LTSQYNVRSIPTEFVSELGSIPVGRDCGTGTGDVPADREACCFIFPARHVVGIGRHRQQKPPQYYWFDSIFSEKFSCHVENTRKNSPQPSDLLAFCWYLGRTFAATFAIPNKGIEQMARKNDGACGNPKLVRTDVDCRAARPKFNEGAWSPAKIFDILAAVSIS
jgi:hypothetical protein